MGDIAGSDARRLLSEKARGDYFFLELGRRAERALGVAMGGCEFCARDYLVDRQTYPFVTLEFVAAGEGELRLGDGPNVPLHAGSCFAYGPSLPLWMRTTGAAMTKYFICLTGAEAKAAVVKPVKLWGQCLDFSGHAELREVVDSIVRKGREHAPNTSRLCLNLFQRLLLELEQAQWWRGRQPDASREMFLRCKAVVDAAPERFASLADVAAATRVGLPTLHRLFRRHQASTPYQYLQRVKMNRAAHDLIGTNRLVKEVAAKWGFADPLHFSRVFRQVHGVSPSQLRASLRA